MAGAPPARLTRGGARKRAPSRHEWPRIARAAGAGGAMRSFVAALLCAVAVAEPPAPAPDPLFPVVKGGKWGYIDRTGRVVVAPRFDEAARFSEGLAPVRAGKQLGYADPAGKLVLVPAFGPAGGTLHRRF